jgi:hypothetical protein
MPDERLALYTTIYPGVERFLPDWYASVQQQTDRNFDIWIGLDSLTPATIGTILGTTGDIRWVQAPAGATPAQVRAAAIELMISRYPAILFVDSDDVLLPSRVAAAREMLARDDVGACALELMDERGAALSGVLGVAASGNAAAILPRCNVFGLSNSAYRTAALRACLPLPEDCVLMDWFLATRAWANGASLAFDPVPRMRYRQHDANIALLRPPFTPAQIATATGRVMEHYRCVLEHSGRTGNGHRAALEAARERVQRFAAAMQRDPSLLQAYTAQLNALPSGTAWWWQVAHPSLEALWMN